MRLLPPALLVLALAACGTKDPSKIDDDEDGFTADIDCDDTDPAVNPDAQEVCNSIDDDCDGNADDEDDDVDLSEQPTYYADADDDGYGAGPPVPFCAQPAGFVVDATDCDDVDPDVNPSAQEVCNDIDDDCDDAIDDADGDVDFSTGATYYADADLDGFGDDAQPLDACAEPPGYVADNTDCDDSRPGVNPDATEVCDGLDTDCNATTSEAGLASFTDAKGALSDITADVSGSKGKPAAWTSTEAGTLAFCDGTFSVSLVADHDLDIVGIPADPSAVTLDGEDVARVLTVNGGLDVSATGLTLAHGEGGGASGGGLFCQGSEPGSTVTLTTVDIWENRAAIGFGATLIDCDLTLDDVTLEGNTGVAGGALYAEGSNVTATDVRVLDNEASNVVGAMYLLGGTHTFDEVHLDGNIASSGIASALTLLDGDLTWSGTVKTDSGATRNVDGGGGGGGGAGVVYLDGATLDATEVDFGLGKFDNSPADLYVADRGYPYVAGDDLTVLCDTNGCGTEVSYDIAAATATSNPFPQLAFGNTFLADSDATLHRFDTHVVASDDCTLGAFVTSTADPAAGPWTVEFNRTIRAAGQGAVDDFVSSGDVGLVVASGRTYALGITHDCPTGSGGFRYEFVGPTNAGIGSGTGYVEVIGSTDPTTVSFYTAYTNPMAQRIHIVDLD